MNGSVVELPMWWLILSAVFFALVALLFIVLCGLVVKLIGVVSGLEPQIKKLVDQVNDLIPTVKGLVVKVEELTEKVEGIADSTKGTVDVVGSRAKSIAGTVDHVAALTAVGFQRIAPAVGMLMAGLKVYGAIREFRSHSHDGKSDNSKALPKRGIFKKHRGVEQSGSSSGS